MWSTILPVILRCEFAKSDNGVRSEPSGGDEEMERPHTESSPTDHQDVGMAMEREDSRVSLSDNSGQHPMESNEGWSPACTHMSEAKEDSKVSLGDNSAEGPMEFDDCWSPACTHMTDEEDRDVARGRQFLEHLSEEESVPDFLADAKIHAWVDGSEKRGQAGFGVHFPHGEYENVKSTSSGRTIKQ